MRKLAKYFLMGALLFGGGAAYGQEQEVEQLPLVELAQKEEVKEEKGLEAKVEKKESSSFTRDFFPEEMELDLDYEAGYLGGRYTTKKGAEFNPQSLGIELGVKKDPYYGILGGGFRTKDDNGVYLASHILKNKIYFGGGYELFNGLGIDGSVTFNWKEDEIKPGLRAGMKTARDVRYENFDLNWKVRGGVIKSILYAEGGAEVGYGQYSVEGEVRYFSEGEWDLEITPKVRHNWGVFLAWVGGEISHKNYKEGSETGFLVKVGVKVRKFSK